MPEGQSGYFGQIGAFSPRLRDDARRRVGPIPIGALPFGISAGSEVVDNLARLPIPANPRQERYYAPAEDPVVALLGPEYAIPEDLARYDSGFRTADPRKAPPYRPYAGPVVVPVRDQTGSWFSVVTDPATGERRREPNTLALDPAMVLWTEEPADGERGFPREVNLGQYAETLKERFKTQAMGEEQLAALESQGLFRRAVGEESDGRLGVLQRVKQQPQFDISPAEAAMLRPRRSDSQNTRLIEPSTGRVLPLNERSAAATEYEEVPVYPSDREGMVRVGGRFNRDYDAISDYLLTAVENATSTSIRGSVDPVLQVQRSYQPPERMVSAVRLQQAVEQQGIQLSEPDSRGVIQFTRPDGTGGALIPEMRVARGGGFTEEPTGRFIKVDASELNRASMSGPGQFLDPGTRGWLKKQTDIPGADMTLPGVIDALAGQADGPAVMPNADIAVVRTARERGVPLEQLAKTPTQRAALAAAALSMSNNPVEVQLPLPGMSDREALAARLTGLPVLDSFGQPLTFDRAPQPGSLYTAFPGSQMREVRKQLRTTPLERVFSPTNPLYEAASQMLGQSQARIAESQGLPVGSPRDAYARPPAGTMRPLAELVPSPTTRARLMEVGLGAALASEPGSNLHSAAMAYVAERVRARQSSGDSPAVIASEPRQPALFLRQPVRRVVGSDGSVTSVPVGRPRPFNATPLSEVIPPPSSGRSQLAFTADTAADWGEVVEDPQDSLGVEKSWGEIAGDSGPGESRFRTGYGIVEAPESAALAAAAGQGAPRQQWIPGLPSSPAELASPVPEDQQRVLDYWSRAGQRERAAAQLGQIAQNGYYRTPGGNPRQLRLFR